MTVDEAYTLISRAIDSGRPARGYLLVGDTYGSCAELMERVLVKLFPDAAAQIKEDCHPDVITLEPQGKSRTIKVARGKDDHGPGMRDGLLAPISETAYSGGWKVGIVRCADRMQEEAANAFLKTLEEPPPKTMFLLLTDRPDSIMPTILSRTQRIDLPAASGLLEDEDLEEVVEAFAARDAAALAAKLQSLKGESPDEDSATAKKAFFATLVALVRRMMIDGSVPRHLAFRNIEAVEDAFRQSEKSMPDDAVVSFMIDRLSWPQPDAKGKDVSSRTSCP